MTRFSIILVGMLFPLSFFAQLKGLVQGKDSSAALKPLFGAKIKLLHTNTGVYSKEDGTFELVLPKTLPDTLVISAFGYFNDTLVVTKEDRFSALHVVLYSDKILPEVLVIFKRQSHGISKLKTLHVEELTSAELRKAACCNLSESFETNASVDVNITDAVSGAKKIQMMGLDGVYTQLQLENIPYLRGLESAFGLQSLPGTWVESIQITKGTGTVVNGYESMAGLVNIEIKKPQEMEPLFINFYQSNFGRSEWNIHGAQVLKKGWSTATFAHFSSVYGNIDHNHDGFRDLPNGDNLAILNRWNYNGKKMEAQFGVNAYQDRKLGGQTDFKRSSLPTDFFGVMMNARHADVFAKTGFFGKKPMQSLGILYNLKWHELDGFFGLRPFSGQEKRAFVQAIYDDILGSSDHKTKVGVSFLFLDMHQRADQNHHFRQEFVTGMFGEYTWTSSRITSVFGGRLDHHNLFGWQWIPRVHAKVILDEWTDFRLTAGKGWRVPNYLIDNVSLLANAKNWILPAALKPETSWNMGGSLVRELKLFGRKASLSADYYFTYFENQLVVDRDQNFDEIVFYNLEQGSYSHSFQAEFSFEPLQNLEIRTAYKYLDVQAIYGGEWRQQVMIPKHRGFVNLAYRTRNNRWEFDWTCSVYGQSRLPIQEENGQLIMDQLSPVFPLMHAQITHNYKKWEFYLGGENLTRFRQANPIIDAGNPFSERFDATNIWGPIMSTMVYTGFRFKIAKKKKK
jgi:outer membrane receptor for ferrienterochelin and colicins